MFLFRFSNLKTVLNIWCPDPLRVLALGLLVVVELTAVVLGDLLVDRLRHTLKPHCVCALQSIEILKLALAPPCSRTASVPYTREILKLAPCTPCSQCHENGSLSVHSTLSIYSTSHMYLGNRFQKTHGITILDFITYVCHVSCFSHVIDGIIRWLVN